ncbi:MAG TPA: hypothetical protein VGM12_11850 [Trebonia sp.]
MQDHQADHRGEDRVDHPVTAAALGRAAVAGLLCSALPMILDLTG